MKTAVSIPDPIFDQAERLARRAKRSRSEIYSRALQEYLARHETDDITAAMDNAVAAVGVESSEGFSATAARQVLNRSQW